MQTMARLSKLGLLGGATLAAGALAGAALLRPSAPPRPAPPASTPNYGFIEQIALAGDGGWDYLSIDPAARRLYVAHGDHVDVLDIDHDTLVARIADTPGVHAVAIASPLGRGFVSDGQSSQVSIFELTGLATIARVASDDGPDAIVFEPSRDEVYAFNGRGHSVTVLDAATGRAVATVALPGTPEFAVADPAAGRVYDNIVDRNLVVAIDMRSHAIVDECPIAPGERASGMGIDTEHHRLFIGCRNQRLSLIHI